MPITTTIPSGTLTRASRLFHSPVTSRDPPAEMEQKRSVALGPMALDPGTARLVSRQFVIEPTGLVHFDPMFGPCGPLYSQDFSSPQRPSYRSQANSPSGSG